MRRQPILKSAISVLSLVLFALTASVGMAGPVVSPPRQSTATPSPALPTGLLPSVAQALARDLPESWNASRKGSGVELNNPKHHLALRLGDTGLRLQGFGGTSVNLRLVAYVQGAQTARLDAKPAKQVQGTRATLAHGSGLSEWYVNSPLGIEQGFTLERPLNHDGSVSLVFDLDSNLKASINDHALLFQDRSGKTVLKYSELLAFDADHRSQPASMSLAGIRLTLNVDTRGARYPVTVDPLFSAMTTLSNPTAASGDNFGYSVAISADGQTALVGSPYTSVNGSLNAGAAYLFRAVNGAWAATPSATFNDPATTANDNFGFAVALSGDGQTALIGASGAPANGSSGDGAAYIFHTVNGAWSTTPAATLSAPASTGARAFGQTVALSADGHTALVGAPLTDVNGNLFAGVAFAFQTVNGTWSTTPAAALQAPVVMAGNFFGYGAALSGDGRTAVIGTLLAPGSNRTTGAVAYLFQAPGGTWSTVPAAMFTDPLNSTTDYFGTTVAVSTDGQTVLIGARGTSVNGQGNAGAAYLFRAAGGAWSTAPVATFQDPVAAAGDSFGSAVALSADGQTALIGAARTTINAHANAGAAYVYHTENGAWSTLPTGTLKDPTTGSADLFGSAVAVSADGQTALIGAFGSMSNDIQTGQAYVFANPQIDLSLLLTSNPAGVNSGQSVTYMLTVSNDDKQFMATNVVLTSTLPAGMSYVSSSAAGGTCSTAGGKVTCTLASLTSETTWQPSITVSATATGSIQNTASVSADQSDPNTANNAANVTTIVNTSAGGGDSSGGGGGGGFGLLSLLLLAPFARFRKRNA